MSVAGARLGALWRQLARMARLAVGIPDYAGYVEHMRRRHPDASPMSPADFARERMDARYGRGRSRCC